MQFSYFFLRKPKVRWWLNLIQTALNHACDPIVSTDSLLLCVLYYRPWLIKCGENLEKHTDDLQVARDLKYSVSFSTTFYREKYIFFSLLQNVSNQLQPLKIALNFSYFISHLFENILTMYLLIFLCSNCHNSFGFIRDEQNL